MRLLEMSRKSSIFIYISIILSFACLFTFFPYHFSHVNLTKETAYSDVHDKVELSLSKMIKEMLTLKIKDFTEYDLKPFKHDLATLTESKKYIINFAKQVNIKRVNFIRNITIEEHGHDVFLNAMVDIYIEAPNIDGPGTYKGCYTFNISTQYPMNPPQQGKDLFFKIFLIHKPQLTLYVDEHAYPLSHVFATRMLAQVAGTKLQDDFRAFSLLLRSPMPEQKILKPINDLIKLNRGITIGNYLDRFPRMLYLSMITITTLGYGDIVPVTTFSRLVVGLEATIGVIWLGLMIAIFSKPLAQKEKTPVKKSKPETT